ncbi:MotA/TolQ/ExbB proton channel family protein [Flammeovirga aprica]|uniref:MotA/TolQ/ExbB proton channel family protein n=1 Tax=Flammeovirga aprica JL-4 TaxID=694437 RepID=A0A7X9RZY3_9BACT|nr:MotA/TolQ/ExbB proton channel family protein [Flammeovirga aprica]NME71779.1 MotA/TolQ/ExbB proton channel family protein [Flammeovirga aprica JL-4]
MNSISEFFYWGGVEAMTTISIFGILMILLLVVRIFKIKSRLLSLEKALSIANELTIFCLVLGIFFQLIGLFGAFQAIEAVGSISMGILAGGLKVSLISTFYGFFYFIIGKLTIIVIKLTEK